MYRETLLGLALAATLAEVEPRLTTRQEEEVWRIFDASMDTAVAAAPLMSHVAVHIPPPSSVSGGGTVKVSTTMPQLHVPATIQNINGVHDSEAELATDEVNGASQRSSSSTDAHHAEATAAPPQEVYDDSHIAFPVYRHCDGVWTVLLKDPTVIVRDELGKSEKMQLDYLKVCLKDITGKPTENKRKRAKKA